MQEQIRTMQMQIEELTRKLDNFSRSSSIDIDVQNALTERLPFDSTNIESITGILKANGTATLDVIVPLAGTKVYYVANSSGGAVTRKLTFTNGILTAET